MDQRNLARLEFNKVIQKLSEHTRSPMGRELVEKLIPQQQINAIRFQLDETTEGRELLRMEPRADIGGWRDNRDAVKRACRGMVLEPKELEDTQKTLTVTHRIKTFLVSRSDTYPIMGEIAAGLGNFNTLEKQLSKAILPGGEIADEASSQLSSIRRRTASAQQQIKERLDKIIRSPNHQKHLQDPIVTMREGRYVVPVKQEYKSQIPGIVHDQSASGATIFVEPMGVVEANNEVRRLLAAEKQEIHRILVSLTEAVARQGEELEYTLEMLGRLDFIMAKAQYSAQLEAWAPKLEAQPVIDIKKGRHPLLHGEVVPISAHLGFDFDSLVITGPNTGGKTVTLKTVGLLVLMSLAGLHVPAEEGTSIGIFDRVFADIGDEQSIEQSLSTFSSHMNNIVGILKGAGNRSLVLLDELGAGTDPTEGAALAQSILEHLYELGARTIATTHYSELKNFAFSRERVENASVEFDPVTLKPTYRLLLGKPGRSNAFEIARRLGLDDKVVDRAKDFLTKEQVEVAELMHNLEVAKHEAERERNAAEALRQDANKIKERYSRREKEMETRRGEILDKARSEARETVRRAKLDSEEMIRQLRDRIKETGTSSRETAIQDAREKLRSMQGRYREKEKKTGNVQGQVPKKITAGMEVFVPRFNQTGIVVEPPGNKDEVQVQVGVIKVNLSLSDIRAVDQSGREELSSSTTNIVKSKSREINTKLNLRGMRADEALEAMEKYIDDAALAGLEKIYLVHGKGTGALRSAIHKELKHHRGVKSYRLGEQGEGDSGVTVVELK
ncbi:MAG: endonuclease MutS2 [Firmicutes bacterium]|nr:endonuclease MutS2 [Bacillota bacterium]